MTLLADTHAVLFWLFDPSRLGPIAAARMADPAERVLVSAATIYEAEIKRHLGKLSFALPRGLLAEAVDEGFEILPITAADCAAAAALPWRHRDPFDRLLIAQAAALGCPLASCDEVMALYDVATVW